MFGCLSDRFVGCFRICAKTDFSEHGMGMYVHRWFILTRGDKSQKMSIIEFMCENISASFFTSAYHSILQVYGDAVGGERNWAISSLFKPPHFYAFCSCKSSPVARSSTLKFAIALAICLCRATIRRRRDPHSCAASHRSSAAAKRRPAMLTRFVSADAKRYCARACAFRF